jgi:hypothetical protein
MVLWYQSQWDYCKNGSAQSDAKLSCDSLQCSAVHLSVLGAVFFFFWVLRGEEALLVLECTMIQYPLAGTTPVDRNRTHG